MISRAYFDTSYLAKLHWNEAGSLEVAALSGNFQNIACCRHGRLEFVAVGYRKLREKAANTAIIREVYAQLCDDARAGAIQWLGLDAAVMERAERFYLEGSGDCFLRASDALHLACAVEHGFAEIYSNDRHLLAAAPHFGLRGLNIIPQV